MFLFINGNMVRATSKLVCPVLLTIYDLLKIVLSSPRYKNEHHFDVMFYWLKILLGRIDGLICQGNTKRLPQMVLNPVGR